MKATRVHNTSIYYFLRLLLFLAAYLKTQTLIAAPLPPDAIGWQWWFPTVQIAAEIFLAGWMWLGFLPVLLRPVL
jgi:hypothetical protein